jgi:hypothetical protein
MGRKRFFPYYSYVIRTWWHLFCVIEEAFADVEMQLEASTGMGPEPSTRSTLSAATNARAAVRQGQVNR